MIPKSQKMDYRFKSYKIKSTPISTKIYLKKFKKIKGKIKVS